MNKELQDLAWSILPKAFKEEVKKDYNYYAHYGIYEERMWAYIEIFGQDNLTSDAEGEEMLMITRRTVQKYYRDYMSARDACRMKLLMKITS